MPPPYGKRGLNLAGVAIVRSRAELINCILWDNGHYSLGAFHGSVVTLSHCCVNPEEVTARTGALILWGEGNISGDPLFVNPAWLEYGLRPGSPAINAGLDIPEVGEKDLAGNSRKCRGRIDIGAYEYCGDIEPFILPQFKRCDANTDGKVDLADVISILAYFYEDGDLPCMDAADCNDDGEITVHDWRFLLYKLFGEHIPPELSTVGCLPLPARCGVDTTFDLLGCETYDACILKAKD